MALNRLEEALDQIDRALLKILQSDARRPTAAIARALNLSRTAVQARIVRLQDAGIIAGYHARLAPGAADGVAAIVSLVIDVRPCSLVVDLVLGWAEVERVYSVAGDTDAVLIVAARSTRALSDLADRLRAVPGVARVETTVILAEHARPPA